jgi:hypothetical protein
MRREEKLEMSRRQKEGDKEPNPIDCRQGGGHLEPTTFSILGDHLGLCHSIKEGLYHAVSYRLSYLGLVFVHKSAH